jgi:hypothetical protein
MPPFFGAREILLSGLPGNNSAIFLFGTGTDMNVYVTDPNSR